jgi:hypothetical protein
MLFEFAFSLFMARKFKCQMTVYSGLYTGFYLKDKSIELKKLASVIHISSKNFWLSFLKRKV